MIDLDEIRKAIQARMDDASRDHYYCGPDYGLGQLPVAFGMHVPQDEEKLARAIKAMAIMATQHAVCYRANAMGGGRPMAALRTQDNGQKLECLVAAIKSASDVFGFYENPPWPLAAEPVQ